MRHKPINNGLSLASASSRSEASSAAHHTGIIFNGHVLTIDGSLELLMLSSKHRNKVIVRSAESESALGHTCENDSSKTRMASIGGVFSEASRLQSSCPASER